MIEMPATFQPRLDILPESQRRLWPELDAVPSDFVLYGGTALALQSGHRVSEDFDFFSSSGFDPDRLQSRLPFFHDLNAADPDAWVQRKRDNLEAFVDRGGGLVKIAFFGGLDTLGRIEDPRRSADSRVHVASLVDLAGMKMRVIQVRGSWKDYVDIHTLARTGWTWRRVWRPRKRSIESLIRGSASGRCSFMGKGHSIGCRPGCSGI